MSINDALENRCFKRMGKNRTLVDVYFQAHPVDNVPNCRWRTHRIRESEGSEVRATRCRRERVKRGWVRISWVVCVGFWIWTAGGAHTTNNPGLIPDSRVRAHAHGRFSRARTRTRAHTCRPVKPDDANVYMCALHPCVWHIYTHTREHTYTHAGREREWGRAGRGSEREPDRSH